MDSIIGDLRYALRGLRQAPGFAFVAVLTLALGIGGTTTIFSAVRAVLLRPLMFPRDHELVQLFNVTPRQTWPSFSPPNFVDLRSRSRSFTELAAINAGSMALSGEGPAEQVQSAQVTGGFFSVLGVAPLHGRDQRLISAKRDDRHL